MRKADSETKEVVFNGVVVGKIAATGDMERDAKAAQKFLEGKGFQVKASRFQAILNQAVGFMNVSAHLYDQDLRHMPFKGISAAPFVVNAAFSIELYLKALAQKHGASLRGHELTKLYKALPPKAREEVEAVIPRCAESRSLGEPPNFSAYLESLNNAFVEWRYLYEAEKSNMVLMEPTIFVMQVLHEACHVPPAA
jgi:hypothetical protein